MVTARVTVLMTTYNGAALIGESIASILAQTFRDFELLVIDDASTDSTREVVAAIGDPRIRLLARPVNEGIVAARNFGFAQARGDYIAALDHDDLSDPTRLEKQVAHLDAHPEAALVATEVRFLTDGRITPSVHPPGGDALMMRWQLMMGNPLAWSSVMFRAETVRRMGDFMRPDYELADDFDFYHRLMRVGDIQRLGEVLTTYRYHQTNASRLRQESMAGAAARVLATAYVPWLGEEAAEAAALLVRHLSVRIPPEDVATLERVGALLERLVAAFCARHARDEADRARVARLAGESWWRCVRGTMRSGRPAAWRAYGRAATLARAFAPPAGEAWGSFLVGLARAVLGPLAPRPSSGGRG